VTLYIRYTRAALTFSEFLLQGDQDLRQLVQAKKKFKKKSG